MPYVVLLRVCLCAAAKAVCVRVCVCVCTRVSACVRVWCALIMISLFCLYFAVKKVRDYVACLTGCGVSFSVHRRTGSGNKKGGSVRMHRKPPSLHMLRFAQAVFTLLTAAKWSGPFLDTHQLGIRLNFGVDVKKTAVNVKKI